MSKLQQCEPHVAILLAAYKGAEFIHEQLDSIFLQTYKNLSLWVSVDLVDGDDVSDAFYHMLLDYCDQKNKLHANKMTVLKGPGEGCNKNFLSLVCNQKIKADYFAFSDQDDIWEPDKISRALGFLEHYFSEIPSLYCSRTLLINARGEEIGESMCFNKKPGFKNALVQSIGGGNTMVFNEKTRNVLASIGIVDIVCHDWWTYLVVSSMDGNIIYDPIPSLKYRQHDNNIIGANMGWGARLYRMKSVLRGRLKEWNDINIKALKKAIPYMTPKNKEIFSVFCESRKKNFLFNRLCGMKNAGVYRQTLLGNIGIWVAAIFKKI